MLGSQRVIGDTVGNFEIVSRLGKGGMGEVWLAEQKSIKTKVAIKMLQASISTNTTHVQRFFNEAVAVSQIHHSGIVKIFDVGFHTGGQAYLVMEYLQGETLTSRIKRTGQLSIAQVADFGRQIASVLDATHHAGITHRDLKPDNIYLVDDAELAGGERVKILDFGIAKLEVRSGGGPRMTSLSASSIGTPNYMSPEQWHSLAEVDWHTDAYAFGCVAFEMACGRPPFQAESMTEICAMHLGDPPPVPSKLVPGLPPQFDDLVARLLEKEPAQRPTMREAMTIFTALGQPYAVGQTTLPPGSPPLLPVMPVVPPPPAASQSLPAATSDHADAPIPPVRTPQQVVAKQPRRVGLFVLLAALAIAGTVGAVVISRSSGGGSAAGGAGSGAPADSGSVTALASPTPDAQQALADDAAAAEVVRDATEQPDAAQVAAVAPDAAPLTPDAGSLVDAGATRATPPIVPTPPPASLTAQQIDAGLGGNIRKLVKKCTPPHPIPWVVRIKVQILPDGTVGSVGPTDIRAASPDPGHAQCIVNAIKRARFPKTERGGNTIVPYTFSDAPSQGSARDRHTPPPSPGADDSNYSP